jgi:hypothetical protein
MVNLRNDRFLHVHEALIVAIRGSTPMIRMFGSFPWERPLHESSTGPIPAMKMSVAAGLGKISVRWSWCASTLFSLAY